MSKSEYKFKAKVWLYPGETANWHFVTLPKDIGLAIKEQIGGNARGFGSVPVTVQIGETTWQTSVFPDKYSGSYLLPLKKLVRQKEAVFVDEEIEVELSVR